MEVVSNLYTDTLRGFQEGEGRRTGGREERGEWGDGWREKRREGRGYECVLECKREGIS